MDLAANGAATADLGRLLGVGTVSGLSDRQLVDRLVREGLDRGDADLAFRALIDRHGSLVWGTCRQILGNVPDAEDAFQATFLVLLRRASSLHVGESLAPWLFQVASRVARRARSDRSRDRARGGPLFEDLESPEGVPLPAPEELRLLHAELERLPARYRNPIVLCHLQGKTHEEAARALRCPIGTLSGRLSRARAMLRSRLERKGWRSAQDLSGLLLPACSRFVVPPGLVSVSVEMASGGASLVPTPVHRLTRGVLRTMFLDRCKRLAVALVAFATIGGTSVLLAQSQAPKAARRVTQTAAKQTEPRPSPESNDPLLVESPPVVVRTVPEAGSSVVDPSLKEIRVTFSKAMADGSWSWSTVSKDSYPAATGKPHYLEDGKTCVLPVKLEPGRAYGIWVNSAKFRNFKDRDGRPAVPYLLVFKTKG
ncbi:sigma-70 family RNA polymerase sigma factor [Aquisphaera insulae]|uniref:sigma-70 family RNA polymerase sigma factor n=1 Tax=Aquisphaera insulae TaxID=2712864 RepID=UPI0013ED2CF1|nr:sigma-70 family RNA polymerase sigma factor [Aquisphaera insulae]